MSLFTALNFTPDDALQEAEQHSRELQVEESFKIYQSALLHLKAKRFEQAEEKFKELFNIDVLRPDRWGFYKYSSPTLDSLRYLAYRNRGVFYYQYLCYKHQTMPPQEIVEYTLKVTENLLAAIQHSECDSAVTSLLTAIFKSFRSPKLERYTLEHELLKESEFTTTIERRKAMLPETQKFIRQHLELLENLKDELSIDSKFLNQLRAFLKSNVTIVEAPRPFLDRIQQMKKEDELVLKEENEVCADITELSWEAIAEAITAALPKYKASNFFSRISDPYNEAEDPIERLKLALKKTPSGVVEPETEGERSQPVLEDSNLPQEESKIEHTHAEQVKVEDSNDKRPLDSVEGSKPLQRTSKRFKEKPQPSNDYKFNDFHESFFGVINDISTAEGLNFTLSTERLAPQDLPQDEAVFFAMSDFYDCLSSWTNKHSEFLNQSEAKNSKSFTSDVESMLQLNALIRTSVLTGDNAPIESLTDLPTNSISAFVKRVNEGNLHFQEVRLLLLNTLLSTDSDGRCLIIDTFWSPVLFKAVEFLIMSVESNLFSMIEADRAGLNFLGISIYEVLVNMIGNIYSNISSKKLQGQKVNELETQKNKLERKVNKWALLLEDSQLESERSSYRFLWAKFCFLQYSTDILDQSLLTSIQEIERAIELKVPDINVPYSNYNTIPHLNLKTVQSQLSRLKIIRKITSIDVNTPQEDNDVATKQQMEIIRKALITDELLDPATAAEEEISMEKFLRSSPFLLKVKLWRLLISFYSHRDTKKARSIYFKIMEILYQRLCSQEYAAQSQLQRQQSLLLTVNCIGNFTKGFIDMLLNSSNDDINDTTTDSEQLRILLKVLQLLYPIVFYESMCQRDHNLKSFFRKAVKSSTRLKNIFTDTVSSIIYMVDRIVPKDKGHQKEIRVISTRLIRASHGLLGGFGFCDASDGTFLQLTEQLLCKLNDDEGFLQIKQVLWCRYHLAVTGENAVVDQHNTKGQTMSQESAVAIGKFLISSHYGNRNPLSASGSKTNLKQILDSIIQVIGEVDVSANHILSRNEFFVEQYLKSMITTNCLRKAFQGELSLELIKPNDRLQCVADVGLFYAGSIQALNLYKARKKATQARPSELDSIISTLKTDIIYNTERYESWFLLGKCYSYIVEDDLIWTSDKIATGEKRRGTTIAQRKSILCYLMALGLAIRSRSHITDETLFLDYQQIMKELFETLSEEMFNGYFKPMEKSCFLCDTPATFKLMDCGELSIFQPYGVQTVSDYNIQQAILLGFSKANQIELPRPDPKRPVQNWKSLYYTAKILFKRSVYEFKADALDILQQACDLSIDAGKDTILEPHYFLVVSCFKLVKSRVMTPFEAFQALRRNPLFSQREKEDTFWNLSDVQEVDVLKGFSLKILELLRGLLALDKMKWHHRPRYRIARILYEELHDLEGAIAEMDELIFLKSSNKSLVNIWKPEYERPGKHFIYTFQYVMFYLDLLYCRNDYVNIALVAKKLKRFGPGMVNVALATERATKLFCQTVQSTFKVDEKYALDKILPSLNYQLFLKTSDELFQAFDKDKYDEKVLDALVHATQLKKGNTGYDGICLALYFTFIYLPWRTEKDEESKVTESPLPDKNVKVQDVDLPDALVKGKATTNRKRVSKKDAFDRISQLVEKKIT